MSASDFPTKRTTSIEARKKGQAHGGVAADPYLRRIAQTDIGQTVVLNGWVNTYRAYNDQIFVDLRDRYGLTQVVFEADQAELFAAAQGHPQ